MKKFSITAILLSFGLCTASSASPTPPAVTVHELAQIAQGSPSSTDEHDLQDPFAQWQDQRVTVHGFLYQSDDGGWVLAPQPNLKTCCVGSAQHARNQIRVKGEIRSVTPGLVVAVDGTFHAKPKYDTHGQLQALFELDDAIVLEEDPTRDSASLTLFIGLFLAASVFVFSSRLMKKNS